MGLPQSNICHLMSLFILGMAMPDTNAFKVLRAQKPHNDEELELIQGDFIYITDDSWSTSPEHWVYGTSWLTGQGDRD